MCVVTIVIIIVVVVVIIVVVCAVCVSVLFSFIQVSRRVRSGSIL